MNEPRYNLLCAHPEAEVFPTTMEQGIGNVVFSPVAHGMLTGKYLPGEPRGKALAPPTPIRTR